MNILLNYITVFHHLSHSVLVMKYVQHNTSVKMYLDSTEYINDLTKQICTLKRETKMFGKMLDTVFLNLKKKV